MKKKRIEKEDKKTQTKTNSKQRSNNDNNMKKEAFEKLNLAVNIEKWENMEYPYVSIEQVHAFHNTVHPNIYFFFYIKWLKNKAEFFRHQKPTDIVFHEVKWLPYRMTLTAWYETVD